MEEDFDVDALAAYLHLTPAQIEKMANRGRLPGRRIAGKWRFSASEIHHWFEQRIGVSDQSELIEVEAVLDRTRRSASEDDPGSLAELLSEKAIWVPLPARTKASVIETICRRSAEIGLLWDCDKMATAIGNRESLHPTALENGVALLHPRRPLGSVLGDPFLALGITTTGIPFGGPRGCLTDVFFLIASNSEPGHLKTLARLSRLISAPEFLAQLRSCEDAQTIWKLIRDTERNLST